MPIDRAIEVSHDSLKLFFPFIAKGDKMYDTKEFKDTAKQCASTLDFIVMSLGPDLDLLYNELINMAVDNGLSKKLRPEHWKTMRESLMFALEQSLGSGWVGTTKAAWEEVYDTISAAMSKAFRPSRRASIQ